MSNITTKIDTWYDLKRFVVDELTGDQLGQPVELLVGSDLIIIHEVTKAPDGDLTLDGHHFD